MTSYTILRVAAVVMISTTRGAWAQASFKVQNVGPGLYAPVRDWTGLLLKGEQWRAEVYGGATPTSLSPLVSYYSHDRAIVPFYAAGFFRETGSADYPSVDGVPPAGWVWLQVKVWDIQLGDTYEVASAQGMGGYGESDVFFAKGGDPRGPIPGPMPYLVGLQSFSVLQETPEPSAAALLAFGGLGLWAWRRRARGHRAKTG